MYSSGKVKAARWTFFFVLLISWTIIAGSAVQRDIQVTGDTEGWLRLSETTSNITQIEVFLQNAVDGIYKWNIETGYYDPVAHTSENDMSVLVGTINDFIVRAHNISLIPENSTERATAMLVFRAQLHSFIDNYNIGDTPSPHAAYWWSTTTLHAWQIWAWAGWGFNLIIFLIVNCTVTSVYEHIECRKYEAESKARDEKREAEYKAAKLKAEKTKKKAAEKVAEMLKQPIMPNDALIVRQTDTEEE